MDDIVMTPETLVLLADGRRARGLLEARRGAALAEAAAWAMEISDAERITPRDRPPRSFDRVGQGRHAMEAGADPHEDEERRFLLRVAQKLTAAAQAKAFDHLVIAAAPRALGILRAALPDKTRAMVQFEIAKDIVDEDAAAVAKRLADLRMP
ncbi:MAG: host attachment protein [Alphaproteobacteria bacterium]|nr:host attachment protein [Alphaproteobacteria bacterium]